MNSKLEEKLRQYEKSTPITNDTELLRALDEIITEENAKLFTDRDYELIDEAVDAILTLRGEDVEKLESLAEECTDKNIYKRAGFAQHLHNKSVFKAAKIKRLVPLVAVLVVALMTTIVAYTSGYDWLNAVGNRIMDTFEENQNALAAGEYYEFSAIGELAGISECENMLLPSELPEDFSYKRISVQKDRAKLTENNYADYTIISIVTNRKNSWQEISIKPSAVSEKVEGEESNIGGIDLIYYKDGDRHCGAFERGIHTYKVSAATVSELNSLLSSLSSNIREVTAEEATNNSNTSFDTSGMLVTAKKYDYEDGNVMILDVGNYSSKNYTITIEGIYKDANGEKLKSEKKIYEAYAAGWSNYFIFDPGIEFDSFSYEITGEEYTGKTYSNYLEFENKVSIGIMWMPSDGRGNHFIPQTPEEAETITKYITISAGIKGVSISSERIKYKADVVIFDNQNDIWKIDSTGIKGDVSMGEGNVTVLEITDVLWDDRDQFEIPQNLKNATGLVAVHFVSKR